jgi:hypothetical protein
MPTKSQGSEGCDHTLDYETYPPEAVLELYRDQLDERGRLPNTLALGEVPPDRIAKITITVGTELVELDQPLPVLDTDYRKALDEAGVQFKFRTYGKGTENNKWVHLSLELPTQQHVDALQKTAATMIPSLFGEDAQEEGELPEITGIIKAHDQLAAAVYRIVVFEDSGLRSALESRGIESNNVTGVVWEMPLKVPST